MLLASWLSTGQSCTTEVNNCWPDVIIESDKEGTLGLKALASSAGHLKSRNSMWPGEGSSSDEHKLLGPTRMQIQEANVAAGDSENPNQQPNEASTGTSQGLRAEG